MRNNNIQLSGVLLTQFLQCFQNLSGLKPAHIQRINITKNEFHGEWNYSLNDQKCIV